MSRPVEAPRALVILVVSAVLALSLGAAQAETDTEVDDETLELGREIFIETAQPPCGICHTLADADTAGTIAPRLDDMQPTVDEVRRALEEGPGAMPTYTETLSEEEIEAVSHYVAAVAGAD